MDRTVETPIRLMFGGGNWSKNPPGFSIIYEAPDGTADSLLIEYVDDPDFSKIRFIGSGESRIVWTVRTEERGVFHKTSKEIREVKEVLIRRDAQLRDR